MLRYSVGSLVQKISPKHRGGGARFFALFKLDFREEILFKYQPADLSEFARFRQAGANIGLFKLMRIDDKDLIINVGGYMGDSTTNLRKIYMNEIFVIEPIPEYVNSLNTRFKNMKDITIFPFALADSNQGVQMKLSQDSTGIYAIGETNVTVPSKSAKEFFAEFSNRRIGIVLMNIEGGEYILLKQMLEENLVSNIKYIAIQFHDVFEQAEVSRQSIRNQLRSTHSLKICYDWVWEIWEQKSVS